MFNFFRKKIVTRIAPSPTGFFHIGTARTALFNYLFAKKHHGKFIIRIEDTDTERNTKEFEESIISGLKWFGLDADEFYRQSERPEVYKKYIAKMIANGSAYISKETEGERQEIIRFKNPNKKITFADLIHGEISFDTQELGDFVIAKSETEPLYHLAVVVDDHEMGITHIIRGDDGISNTPRQILIQEAIGAKIPTYAHLPLILGKDRSKLSKRHGAVSIDEYVKRGYLKQAMTNYLAFLGWNPGTDKEIFSLDELIRDFDIEKVNKSGAIFDEEKLNWYNREYLKKLSDGEYLENVRKYFQNISGEKISDELLLKIKNIILERITVLNDIEQMISTGEIDYLFKDPQIENPEKIIWKDSNREEAIKHLGWAKNIIGDNTDLKSADSVKQLMWEYATENGRGQVLWPIRFSLSGLDKSPDPFVLIYTLGKETAERRILNAINKLKNV